MTLHERLATILRLRQMTQRELAAAIDYSEATISKWVQGRAQPPTAGLMSLCQTLHVSADWLLWGTGEAQPAAPQPTTTPRWEAVDTTFSTTSRPFDAFVGPARSLFFTSVGLTRAFDAHSPVLSQLIGQGITLRFVFPQPDLWLAPYDTDGLVSPNQYERKRLHLLSSLYQLQEWRGQCPVELRLTDARPVNNLLAVNYDHPPGRILYIPYLYGDFEHGPRPGFIIDQAQHPQWYEQFYTRYVSRLWEAATPIADFTTLIEQLRNAD